MTFELKTISPDAVPRALARAERYRLLNEPAEAESICLDVLRADPDNSEAMVTLILALTDQFDEHTSSAARQALDLADRLSDPYDHAYYSGIVWERQARAELHRARPGIGPHAYVCLREAMERYEQAEALRPSGNDDPILRWNTCARLIMRDSRLAPPADERFEPLFLE
jgi:hypothetical protein